MKRSVIILGANDPLRMAAATSFFTTFALPPILIILIQAIGLFVDPDRISYVLIRRIGRMLGRTSAVQLKETLENFSNAGRNWYATLAGFIFLLFVATTLFQILNSSLDQIWCIRLRDKPGFKFRLKRRLMALAIIIFAGVLFIVGLLAQGIQALFGDYVNLIFEGSRMYFNIVVNEFFFVLMSTAWFAIIFRCIGDARPAWKICWAAGGLTALLFTAGKYILKSALALSNIGTVYGASGSIVLIMLFVFYSSFIFYFGGCFIKAASEHFQTPLLPVKQAYEFETHEIEN